MITEDTQSSIYFLGGPYHGRHWYLFGDEFHEHYYKYSVVHNSTVASDDLEDINVEVHKSLDLASALLALLSVELPEYLKQRFEQDILKHYA